MGIQKKVDFSMTITMTTSPNTVPKGKTIGEGNSRQWMLGRYYRKCGSVAVKYVKHGLKAVFYLPSYHT